MNAKLIIRHSLTSCLILFNVMVCAEVKITGFASLVSGKVINGDEFLADYPKTGIYDNDWSFSPDTSVGVQLKADIDDKTSITLQVINNGANEYQTEASWAYLNYQYTPELSIQLGRKRLPLYYYSDTFDLGYAYHWIRPPTDNYTWQIDHYNGLSFVYEPASANTDMLFNLYFGSEEDHDNNLLSLFSGVPVNETWKNIIGLVGEFSKNWYEIRLAYMRSQLDRDINNVPTDRNVKQHFHGISVNLYYDNIVFLSEFNAYERPNTDIKVNTNMQSIGYTINKITPHITRSELKQASNPSGRDEHHYTNSLGIRWDYKPNIALKIQYDKTTDKGINVPVLGNAELISLGIDVVF